MILNLNLKYEVGNVVLNLKYSLCTTGTINIDQRSPITCFFKNR